MSLRERGEVSTKQVRSPQSDRFRSHHEFERCLKSLTSEQPTSAIKYFLSHRERLGEGEPRSMTKRRRILFNELRFTIFRCHAVSRPAALADNYPRSAVAPGSEGTSENSPPFQRWVAEINTPLEFRRDGRKTPTAGASPSRIHPPKFARQSASNRLQFVP
jgi:hypothetical protein